MYQDSIDPRQAFRAAARLRAMDGGRPDRLAELDGRRTTAYAGSFTAAVALALGLLSLWGESGASRAIAATANAAVQKEAVRLTVTVVPAAKAKPTIDLSLPGTMLPIQETPIYARTSGYVKRWHVDMGAKVKAGDTLADIETPELDRELKQAVANLRVAKANLELARTTADRWRAVLKDNAVAPQEVDEKVGAYEARKADVAAAEANVQRLRELKAFERVVAPFDGIITLRSIEVGQLIAAGNPDPSRLMFKLAKTDTLRLFVNVPQSHVRLVQPGAQVAVVLREYPGQSFPAKVVRTAGALDAQSKTMLAEVHIDNAKGDLVAGMYALVKFTLQQPAPAIVLPANTLIVRTDGPQVATVENDAVHMRKVILGRDFGTTIEILSGLKEKEMVVTNPSDSIAEGVMVKAVVAQAEKPAAPPPGAPAKPPGVAGDGAKPAAVDGRGGEIRPGGPDAKGAAAEAKPAGK
jgi:RND family efflux transporter MFP subunit